MGARISEAEEVIGREAMILLAEAFGGTRLFIPVKMSSAHVIAKTIGIEAARKLTERFAPDVLRIPLMREARAIKYRSQGRSNAQIAQTLGMTETAVNVLFRRCLGNA